MIMDVMLPWFPVVLGAAIGGRLIGQRRATWLGLMCAVYWVVIVQMTVGRPFWTDASLSAAMLAGSAAIVGLADWASRSGSTDRRVRSSTKPDETVQVSSLSHTMSEFDDWLESKRAEDDPWASFDEFIRRTLHDACGAIHVRPFRILTEGDILVPMRAASPEDPDQQMSSRAGILGHVATTGRTYYADDPSQGDLVRRLASQSSMSPQWCFAIRQGGRSIGVVSVGGLSDGEYPRAFLHSVESLVSQFWSMLAEVCRGRAAVESDHVSGVLRRSAFLKTAQSMADVSYRGGEPVAVAIFALEGHRRLLDLHLWETADEVIKLMARTLADRIRPDDRLGRLDDTRFVVLLRRVDSALASLIAGQLVDVLGKEADAFLRSAGSDVRLHVRCGVTGSGSSEPNVERLLGQAVVQCHVARQQEVPLASDVESDKPHGEVIA